MSDSQLSTPEPIPEAETATASTYFLLHAHQLSQINSCLLQAQLVAPVFYFPTRKFNATHAGNAAGNMQHVSHIAFNTRFDSLSDMLIRYYARLFWVI